MKIAKTLLAATVLMAMSWLLPFGAKVPEEFDELEETYIVEQQHHCYIFISTTAAPSVIQVHQN